MDTVQPTTFGTLLKRYRLAAGLTQETLAERAGISARTVSDLERGLYKAPQRDTVTRLSDALGLAVDDAATVQASVKRQRGPSPRTAGRDAGREGRGNDSSEPRRDAPRRPALGIVTLSCWKRDLGRISWHVASRPIWTAVNREDEFQLLLG